jgi:hypothetical protein
MKSVTVDIPNPKLRRALEARLEAEGFPVERPQPKPAAFARRFKSTTPLRTTEHALALLMMLDGDLVGTPHYMGLSYFWASEYRHWLRPRSRARLCQIHDALLAAGLPVDAASPAHEAIIRSHLKPSEL